MEKPESDWKRYKRYVTESINAKTEEEKKEIRKAYKHERLWYTDTPGDSYFQFIHFVEEFLSQDKYKNEQWRRGDTYKEWEFRGFRTNFHNIDSKLRVYDTREWTGESFAGTPLYPQDFIICHGDRKKSFSSTLEDLRKEIQKRRIKADTRYGFF